MVTIIKLYSLLYRFWFLPQILLRGLAWAILHVWTQNYPQISGRVLAFPSNSWLEICFSKMKGLIWGKLLPGFIILQSSLLKNDMSLYSFRFPPMFCNPGLRSATIAGKHSHWFQILFLTLVNDLKWHKCLFTKRFFLFLLRNLCILWHFMTFLNDAWWHFMPFCSLKFRKTNLLQSLNLKER